jgi:hypothetical protein
LDTRPKRGASNPETRAMLSGCLVCGVCDDSPMYRITTKDGQYYRCSGRGAARKGCGNMVPVSVVDSKATEIIEIWFNSEILERTMVPGNAAVLDAKLQEVKMDIRQLDPDDYPDDDSYDAEMTRLRGLRDTIRDEERIPDHHTSTPTGKRYSAVFTGLPVGDRGSWLKGEGFTVDACRGEVGVRGVQDDAGPVRITRFALAIV